MQAEGEEERRRGRGKDRNRSLLVVELFVASEGVVESGRGIEGGKGCMGQGKEKKERNWWGRQK